MARQLLHEDTPRGEVAAFLAAVEAAYPTPSRSPAEDAHLKAIFREARLVRQGAVLPAPATGLGARARRLLSGALISCTVGAGAAVGIATAAGGGPFAHLLNPPPAPPSVAAVPSVAVSASLPATPNASSGNPASRTGRSSSAGAKPDKAQQPTRQAVPGAAGRQRAEEARRAGQEKADAARKAGQERAEAARKAGQEKAAAAREDARDKPDPVPPKPAAAEPRTPGKSEDARSRGGDAGNKGKGPKIDVPGASRSQDAPAKGQ